VPSSAQPHVLLIVYRRTHRDAGIAFAKAEPGPRASPPLQLNFSAFEELGWDTPSDCMDTTTAVTAGS